MSVIVISCGRTGTNIALALLSGNKNLNPDSIVENKTIFKNIMKYGNKYLAKTDTTYLPNYESLKNLMNLNPNMKMVWTIRDPRDVIMSKIRRGQPKSKGGDNYTEKIHSDGTPKTAIISLRKMFETYKKCKKDYPKRTFLVKMEDVLLKTEKTSKDLCNYLDINYDDNMLDFPKRMKNKYKKQRYGNKKDKSQVGLWKDWKNVYGRFFVKNKYNMEDHFNNIKDIIKYFNYD